MPTEFKVKLPVLISYAYLRALSAEDIHYILSQEELEVLLDCGAFTALNCGKEISLRSYIEFLHQYKNMLFGYIALDVLGNPSATESNLQTMLKEGLQPIPVHVRGDDEARMDYLFTLSKWVAFGGLRRPHRGLCPKSYVKLKMEWSKGRNCHWLGYTKYEMIQRFRPYSCDSASWLAGQMYGEFSLYRGCGLWSERISYEKMKRKSNLLLEREARCLGFSREDLQRESLWRGGKGINQIGVMQWVKYVLDLRRQFQTRLFLATGPSKPIITSFLRMKAIYDKNICSI